MGSLSLNFSAFAMALIWVKVVLSRLSPSGTNPPLLILTFRSGMILVMSGLFTCPNPLQVGQ